MDVYEEVKVQALRAREASEVLAQSDVGVRNAALSAMAEALRSNADAIVAANARDVEGARAKDVKESLVDRLYLDAGRIEDMAGALEELIELPDPLGKVLAQRELYNGIELTQVSVSLGVVAVVYEARPNVTADAAGICLKSGNACVLRGGSLAAHSNAAIAEILAEAVESVGLPKSCIEYLAISDRAATDALMGLYGIVDVLVPRGGAGLIRHCVETAKVPVIETGTGNCHVYVHESADPDMALSILINAKTRRYGVCNAAETLLVDEKAPEGFLARAIEALAAKGVKIHADAYAGDVARSLGVPFEEADETDWETEYLAPEIAIRRVNGLDEAISHINRYGTMHSEAIVAGDSRAVEEFLNRVDAAAVYANASTAFTDGGQFGLGAEIGISTQKLHVRGPFALEGLTSTKYLLRGSGQVRD